METCSRDQAQAYKHEFGDLAQGRAAEQQTTRLPSPAVHQTLAELGLDSLGGNEYVYGCAD